MSCTKIQFLVLVHLMCKAILVTAGKFKTFWSVLQWWPFGVYRWILVDFGAPQVRPHYPFITCSDSCPLSSVHLIQKWEILVTQDKFKTQSSVMLWKQLWCTLINFGAFSCTSSATPWPLHYMLWVLSSFKCPFNPKMDHISHSNKFKTSCSVMRWWPF